MTRGSASVRAAAALLAALAMSAGAGARAQEGSADAGPAREAGPQAAPSPIESELVEIEPGPEMPLSQALRLADERNLSLAAARAEIARADADLYRAWAVLLPAASGAMNYTHKDHEDKVSSMDMVIRNQDDLSGAVEIAAPVIDARAWVGIRAAEAGLRAAELTAENARQILLLTVARAHYQALTARCLIAIQEGVIRSVSRHLDVAETRLVSGVGSRLDVLRAKGELVRARESLVSAHASFANARDALGVLTGAGGLPMPVDEPDLPEPSLDEGDLVSRALRDREDIELKRAMVTVAEKQLDAAWMQLVPSLRASWQLTHQFTEPSGFGDKDRTRWNSYLVLSVPIYDQTRYADLDRQRAAVRKATIEAEDSTRNAELEVRRARRNYLAAVEKTATAAEQAALSRETLLLTESEYSSGTGSSLKVTDASRTHREAEINLATRRFEAQLALLELLRAAGRDMSESAEPR